MRAAIDRVMQAYGLMVDLSGTHGTITASDFGTLWTIAGCTLDFYDVTLVYDSGVYTLQNSTKLMRWQPISMERGPNS